MICVAAAISAVEALIVKLKIEAKTCVLFEESPTPSEVPEVVTVEAEPTVVTRPTVEVVREVAADAVAVRVTSPQTSTARPEAMGWRMRWREGFESTNGCYP